jgi:hypothetical protein
VVKLLTTKLKDNVLAALTANQPNLGHTLGKKNKMELLVNLQPIDKKNYPTLGDLVGTDVTFDGEKVKLQPYGNSIRFEWYGASRPSPLNFTSPVSDLESDLLALKGQRFGDKFIF